MKRESLIFAVSGTFFGLLMGWMLGSQRSGPAPTSTATPAASTQAAPAAGGAAPAAAPLDTARAAELERQATASPTDAAVREALGNLYFDAARYDSAVKWYEASLSINPKNVDVSTDLAVSFYYMNDVDKALVQFDKSLAIDAKHLKTLLNQGVVRAFGKNDLAGAAASWEKLVSIAPDSEEGKRAKQGLEGIKAAHQGGGTPAAASGGKE